MGNSFTSDQVQDATGRNPFTKNFKKKAENVIKHFNVPGVSIVVINGDETFYNAYGFSSLPKQKATPDTLYYVGSTTKSFSAAALSMLLEDSQESSKPLSLDTKICSIIRDDFVLPDEYTTTHATLADALTYQLGFPPHHASYGGKGYAAKDTTRALRHLTMTNELRAKFDYFNIGYIALQHVIETLTGSWIGDFHKSRIWGPLSMDNTYIRLQDALNADKDGKASLAHGYAWDPIEQKLNEQPWWDSQLVGDGGIISSVRGFSKYLRAMIDKLLPLPKSAQAELGVLKYALGWVVTCYKGYDLILHSGGVPGFATRMAYLPSLRWVAVLMANADTLGNHCLDALFLHLIDDFLGIKDRKDLLPEQEAETKQVVDSFLHGRENLYSQIPDTPLPLTFPLESYAGTYENEGCRQITLAVTKPLKRIPVADREKDVLHADVFRCIELRLDLKHISGEYSIVYSEIDIPSIAGFSAGKAQFRIGEAGQVDELALSSRVFAGDTPVLFRNIS